MFETRVLPEATCQSDIGLDEWAQQTNARVIRLAAAHGDAQELALRCLRSAFFRMSGFA